MDTVFGFIVIIGLITWELSDHPFSDTTSLYFADHYCGENEESCEPTLGVSTFRVIPELQAVTGYTVAGDESLFQLQTCLVVDKNNWECKHGYASYYAIGRVNGTWMLSDRYEVYSLKSHWWLTKIFRF